MKELRLFCILGFVLVCDAGYAGADSDDNFVNKLYASIQEAKKAKDILSGITNVEIAEEIIRYFITDTKRIKGVDKELQALSREISGTHVATFLLDQSLTSEEAIELAVLFDKVPLYAKLSATSADRKGIDTSMVMFDEMNYRGAHEGIDADHRYYLNDKQLDYLIGQSQKFRVHWYRAREMLKLALRRIK